MHFTSKGDSHEICVIQWAVYRSVFYDVSKRAKEVSSLIRGLCKVVVGHMLHLTRSELFR